MTLKAPNGNTSNLTPEQYAVVRTNAFKEWFGDWEKLAMAKVKDPAMDEVTLANLSKDVSKVVDENGEPLVVYHGTPYEFTIFKKDKPTIGAYGQGFYFTNDKGFASNYAKIEGSKILTCFLNVKKIFEIDNDELPIGYEKYSDMADNKGKSRDFTIKLKSLLYDGVFANNTYNENEFVVFEPNQIKLADGTNTTFDRNNTDIRFNNGGNVKTDFNDYENSAFRKAIVSFWNDFTNSEISNYLDIGKEDYVIDNERGVLVITRSNRSSIFSNVEKQKFQNWIAPYLDTKRKKDIANYFLDYSIVDNTIIIKISQNEMYNNGGKMKSVSNGTITIGASHDNGGIPVYNKGTGQMLEVEGGEGIINKRSMALKKEVTLNGDKMTPCEAASEINQMAGGVAYNCDNAVDSKEKYNGGGEFKKRSQAEQEKPKSYTKMNREYTPQRRKPPKCACSKRYYDGGGEFDTGIGSLDSFINSRTPTGLQNAQDQEIIDYTITTGREMLDTDILPIILKNIDAKWKPYFVPYQKFNLYQLGWRIQFGSSRQWAGLCSWDGEISKNIYISIQFVKHDRNWKENAIDTIQHEIAHACVTEAIIMKVGQTAFKMIDPLYAANTGHGESWKSICNAINPDGDCSVFYTKGKMKESFRPYKYECVNCGNKGYGNKIGFTSNCFKCFRPIITSKNIV
jgi:hypothetical protein